MFKIFCIIYNLHLQSITEHVSKIQFDREGGHFLFFYSCLRECIVAEWLIDMKNILIVSYGMGCGGAEKSLISFLRLLPKDKWNVDLIIASPYGMYMKQIPTTVHLLNDQYELENFATSLKGRRRKICGFNDLINQVRWQLGSHFLYKNLSRNEKRWELWGKYLNAPKKEYDLAISYMNGPTNYYVIDKIRAKKKVLWIHNEFEKLDVNYEYERKYYEKADKIVTISQDCVDSFTRVYPDLKDKTLVLENISSPDIIWNSVQPVPKDDSFFEFSGLKILSIGRLSPQKGYEIAIDAAVRLKRLGIRFYWCVLGEGELRTELEDAISKNGISDQMKLVGIKENPYPYIAHCDIFAQTSHYEGKSIALDEAKILHKPILVTDYTTVNASIKNEINGLIVGKTGKSVSEGLFRLMNDSALRENLIRNLEDEKTGNEEEIYSYLKLIKDLVGE